MRHLFARLLIACGLIAALPATAQTCPETLPAQGAPAPANLFPADNWWNTDISAAPVDTNSANFISFINNGGTRRLHPDFGGEAGGNEVYGFPYIIVGGGQAKKAVTFDYWDESDGVNYDTGAGVPFYPIPEQAIGQAHWVEGGAPGNVDQRGDNDRHILIVDCTNRDLYELYNVWYSTAEQKWYAGSGAFFDLDSNARRPDTWTSADAAGLAIFPGLVRYDEATNPAIEEIRHAFRVTVRTTNGYVYPASHRAGTTAGALPMGARLRLKKSVDGVDPALRTTDPVARRIFRAMQKYGLIVADNGTDMYISGTFDVRWNNDALNPAFNGLTANDFEVVQLGWKPAAPVASLREVGASPNPVTGGQNATGVVALSAAAPAGGAVVALSSASAAFSVPASVTVPAGQTNANFTITTVASDTSATGTLSATYAGVTRTAALTVSASAPALSIDNVTVSEGQSGTKSMNFTVRLSRPSTAPVTYWITTANGSALAGSDYVARSLTGETIPAGSTQRTFTVTINGDTAVETNESLTVKLSEASGATVADGLGEGIILNDDGATLSIDDISVAEGSAGNHEVTFTVRLSQALATPVSYSIATSNGSALAGSDYTARSLTGQTIAAGQTTRTFSVVVQGDTMVEPNENFYANLSAAEGATILDARGLATLVNDEGPRLSIADLRFAEGNSGSRQATFTVRLSQAATVPVTYAIATANNSALLGSDYVGRSLGGETIPAGQTSRSFAVTVNGDAALEPNESFIVNLSQASGASIADGSAYGIMLNDDGPTLSIGDVAVAEGQSGLRELTFTVRLSKASTEPVSYTIATSGLTATSGPDFEAPAARTDTIPAGQTTHTYVVWVRGDVEAESNETLAARISGARGATIYDEQAVGTITNDD